MSFGNLDKKEEIVSELAINLYWSIMAFNFHTYLESRNNFCYSYNGNYKEFIWQLLQVREMAKKAFPDLNLFISCVSEIAISIGQEGIIDANDLKNHLFLRTEELKFDMQKSPVLNIIEESNLESDYFVKATGKRCFIDVTSRTPFKSYDKKDITPLLRKRFDITENVEQADVVCASENESLYKWAFLGKSTILIGESEIYKKLFPQNEILSM